jgi:hypothetical protein
VLPELRAQEFSLYLLYPGRKFLPFKSRAFIDLVLESSGKSQEYKKTGPAPNRRRCMGEQQVEALAV